LCEQREQTRLKNQLPGQPRGDLPALARLTFMNARQWLWQ